jgi:hypothetical protein
MRSRYVAADRLRSAPVAAEQGDSNTLLMVVQAFFDESLSGQDNNDLPRIFTFGGYVSTIDRWSAFELARREYLDAKGVQKFHAVDLNNFRRAFTGWTPWSTSCARMASIRSGGELPPRDRPRVAAPEQAGDPNQRLRLRPTAAGRELSHVALGRRQGAGR